MKKTSLGGGVVPCAASLLSPSSFFVFLAPMEKINSWGRGGLLFRSTTSHGWLLQANDERKGMVWFCTATALQNAGCYCEDVIFVSWDNRSKRNKK